MMILGYARSDSQFLKILQLGCLRPSNRYLSQDPKIKQEVSKNQLLLNEKASSQDHQKCVLHKLL